MVASMLLSTMPMLSVSCSRKVICEVVNEETEPSSMTALHLAFEQHRKNDEIFQETTRMSAELSGVALFRMSERIPLAFVIAACPTSPFAKLNDFSVGLAPFARHKPESSRRCADSLRSRPDR